MKNTAEIVSQSVLKSSAANSSVSDSEVEDTVADSEVEDTLADSEVEDTLADSGFEDTLTIFGWSFLVVGVSFGIFFIWKSGDITKKYESIDAWGEHGYSWSLMIFGIISIMQGLFLRLILEGIAEILRLLRRKK